ncbi:hypothetical protein VTJ49DRAFT_3496 [Mycothermus thermophilus]|uniref:Chromo domain-containing protein n=1 Tax=Humicola insolens TaxID=85995 RepID=A0ABR3V7D2_HUMIN
MDNDAPHPHASQPRRTTIEIPVHSIGKYVPGSSPRPRISLALPRDSTAYIIGKRVLQADENMRVTTRRVPYYHIGFTDAPTVKMLVPCHKALDYVSPREMEEWEYRESERKAEEQARQVAEKTQAGPAKKKPGRPPKARVDEVEAAEEETPSSADEALLLAQEAAGPSLSTPQKSRLRELYEGVEDEMDEMDYEEDLESEDPLALEDDGDDTTLWRTRTLASVRDISLSRASTPLERVSNGSVSGASVPVSNVPSPGRMHPAWARVSQQSQSKSKDSAGARSESSHNVVSRPSLGIPQPAKAQTPSSRTSIFTFRRTESPVPAATTPAAKRRAHCNGVDTPSTSETQKKPPKKQKVQENPIAEPEEEWKVKDLLDDDWIEQDGVRVHRYLVLWKGDWPPDQNPTWEPAENVLDRNLIKRYEKKKREGLLKPYQKAALSSQLWAAANKYSSVAEAFEAGIDEEPAAAVAGESDAEDNEMLLVTDNAAELTADGMAQAPTPMFRSFDSTLARYRRSFSQG